MVGQEEEEEEDGPEDGERAQRQNGPLLYGYSFWFRLPGYCYYCMYMLLAVKKGEECRECTCEGGVWREWESESNSFTKAHNDTVLCVVFVTSRYRLPCMLRTSTDNTFFLLFFPCVLPRTTTTHPHAHTHMYTHTYIPSTYT